MFGVLWVVGNRPREVAGLFLNTWGDWKIPESWTIHLPVMTKEDQRQRSLPRHPHLPGGLHRTLERGRGLYTAEPDPPLSRTGPGTIYFDLQRNKETYALAPKLFTASPGFIGCVTHSCKQLSS